MKEYDGNDGEHKGEHERIEKARAHEMAYMPSSWDLRYVISPLEGRQVAHAWMATAGRAFGCMRIPLESGTGSVDLVVRSLRP